ncbi:MAG TPA: hypothetical protein VH877_32025 [Polyangia bacterium]|jgi:Cu-Zn family superoxide dismutase|nr:hypothetical protein [Polyangia bacterium]
MTTHPRPLPTRLRHLEAAALLAVTLAGAACEKLPTSYVVPGNNTIPEGSIIDPVRQELYTSSVTTGAVYRTKLTDSQMTQFLAPGQDGRIQTLGVNVDPARNRLFVCGGGTGLAFVYDTRNGQLLGKFKTDVTPPNYTSVHDFFVSSNTLVNDVAIQPETGDAFFTDSIRPILFRLPASAIGQGSGGTQNLEVWRDFTGTPLEYPTPDPNNFLTTVNANGIALTPDGKYFIIVQTNTSKLFRVTVDANPANREVREITGITSPTGAGLALGGNTLYVVSPINPLHRFTLAADYASGTEVTLNPAQNYVNSSSAVLYGGRLYVVNAQIITFIDDGSTNDTNPTPPFVITAQPAP